MQPDHLSPFQHYLWQWCEVELRYLRFIKEKNITRHYVLNNYDLIDPKKISDMLDFFSIDHADHETISPPKPVNTNVENGFEKTCFFSMSTPDVRVSHSTWKEFHGCINRETKMKIMKIRLSMLGIILFFNAKNCQNHEGS